MPVKSRQPEKRLPSSKVAVADEVRLYAQCTRDWRLDSPISDSHGRAVNPASLNIVNMHSVIMIWTLKPPIFDHNNRRGHERYQRNCRVKYECTQNQSLCWLMDGAVPIGTTPAQDNLLGGVNKSKAKVIFIIIIVINI